MHPSYALSAAAALALVTALPAPQGDGNPDDHALLDISSLSQDIQDKILKPCTDPLATDADQDSAKVWEGLGCHYLQGALYGNWSAESDTTSLSYIEFISNRMHGPPNRDCSDIENSPCSDSDIQCDDTFFACGHLILNSYSNVFSMYKTAWEKIQEVHDKLQDTIPFAFADTFAPELPDDHFDDFIVGIITLSTLGVGTFAERIIKPYMKARETEFAHVKDGLMLSTGMATPLSLNHLEDGKVEGDTIDAKLAQVLLDVYEAMHDMQRAQVEQLFSGSSDADLALYYLTDKGAFLNQAKQPDWKEVEADITKMFLGALTPAAWKLAPKFKKNDENTWSNAFFINSNKPCGKKPKNFDKLKAEGTKFKEICYEDEGWYLMIAHLSPPDHADMDRPSRMWTFEVQNLPGHEELFSDEGYHGLTARDMLESSVEGWKKGNGVQYWKMPTDEEIITGDGPATYEMHYTKGVREPGFVQMLVCANWDDAVDAIISGIMTGKGKVDPTTSTWPCA